MAEQQVREDVENEDSISGESHADMKTRPGRFGSELRIKLKYSVVSCLMTASIMLAYFLLIDNAAKTGARQLALEKTVLMDAVEVNLADRPNRLRIKLALETGGGDQERWLSAKKYLLADLLIRTAQKKSASELSNEVLQNKFKRELLDEFNYRLDPEAGRITGIYFVEFNIQPGTAGDKQ